jgi:adenylate kinase family enzyme
VFPAWGQRGHTCAMAARGWSVASSPIDNHVDRSHNPAACRGRGNVPTPYTYGGSIAHQVALAVPNIRHVTYLRWYGSGEAVRSLPTPTRRPSHHANTGKNMKKVLVIGPGGAGKSTLARELGTLLNINVIHLDGLYWHPGWIETPRAEWRKLIEELLRRDAWIIDGNYSNTFDLRLEACDTVIFLDIARPICLWRVLKRAILYRGRTRPDMAEGCHERLDLGFIRWVWRYKSRTRPRMIEMLGQLSQGKRVIWLQSQAEIKRFLTRGRDA